MLPSHVDVGGDVNCDEWLGLVERNIALNSDHMDVMWESQPEQEPLEWNSVKIRGETVLTKMEQLRGVPIAENQEQLLELEWNTQSGKDMEFSVSKSNLREESVHFTTALNYSNFDLVPIPVSIVSTSVISEVHVVVTNDRTYHHALKKESLEAPSLAKPNANALHCRCTILNSTIPALLTRRSTETNLCHHFQGL
ncbi:hypothetical protein V6N12_041985 [Hibiscus sabdariffa]|uniref:Uncharacterized protein n=1 Tax=Hibiscus sabdariffa TaxID=183260 RepID=A0ABR2EH33_9ROSI